MPGQWRTETGTGADCSGNEGESNRVYTLSNTSLTTNNGFLVYASGLALAVDSEYSVTHSTSGTTITFLNPLWNHMTVIINYIDRGTTGNDFEDGPLNDLGVTVIRTPVTENDSNIGGQKTYSDGTTENITTVIQNMTKGYYVDKAGETIRADALLFISQDQSMNKHDKIEYNNQTYRVDAVSPRIFEGSTLFKTAILFLVT
jgi:hypothetical protein